MASQQLQGPSERPHSADTINYVTDAQKHEGNSHKANLGNSDNKNGNNNYFYLIFIIIFKLSASLILHMIAFYPSVTLIP
jgi:hypothetical protein